MKTLISIGLSALLLCCQKKEVAMNDFERLLSYKGKTNDVQSEPCKSFEFIVQLKDMNGSIAYVDDLKSYCIISTLDNTYDCQFIGILCGDYKDVLKKEIRFRQSLTTTVVTIDRLLEGSMFMSSVISCIL